MLMMPIDIGENCSCHERRDWVALELEFYCFNDFIDAEWKLLQLFEVALCTCKAAALLW